MYIESYLNEKGKFKLAWHNLEIDHLHIFTASLLAYKANLSEKLKALEAPEKTENKSETFLQMHQMQTKALRSNIAQIASMVAQLEQIQIKPGIVYDTRN